MRPMLKEHLASDGSREYLLKAAGTPMMSPGPWASSLDKLTWLPGESSTRSRSGTRSFTATNAGLVVRKVRLLTGDEATKRARDLRVGLVMRCIILAVKVEGQTGVDDDEGSN